MHSDWKQPPFTSDVVRPDAARPDVVSPEAAPADEAGKDPPFPNTGSESAFGILDVVESFTALRHELKLQVKQGRDLQQAMADGVSRLSDLPQQLKLQAAAAESAAWQSAQKMGLAIAEIDDMLRRLQAEYPGPNDAPGLSEAFEAECRNVGWWAARFCRPFLQRMRTALRASAEAAAQQAARRDSVREALDLLLARVHSWMEQLQLVRRDVVGLPFDPETMHAIDRVERAGAASGEVVEQLRPALSWRGELIQYAEVRIAK